MKRQRAQIFPTMNGRIFLVASLVFTLEACAAGGGNGRIIVIHEDTGVRKEVGPFVVYDEILMSGRDPFVEVVTRDEESKQAILSLYAPQSLISDGQATAQVETLDEHLAARLLSEPTPSQSDLDRLAANLKIDLKGHSAVVFRYSSLPAAATKP